MEDKITKGLLQAEKLVQKIKKKVKRNDLDYTIQAVVDSTAPSTIRYAVRITPINEAVGPMVFVANSIQELHEKLEYRLENGLDQEDLEVKYHEAMIANLTKSREFHEERVKELKIKEEGEE